MSFLYNKETKSSFEIEHEQPDQSKIHRFINLLSGAETKDFVRKDYLIELQNSIVDPRFKGYNFRISQNYVGQSIYPFDEIIHFISPKPEDINELMDGLFPIHEELKNIDKMEIIHAALISYAFVFFHPFEDGNGRIHRFLIHNILAITGFTPKGVMFPVSSVMLKNMDLYDDSLECFSESILPLIENTLSDAGEMEVTNDTKYLYQYMDLTSQVEYLYRFIIETIDGELIKELDFLTSYDICTKKIKEVVDLPNNKLSLLMKFLLQNDYKLSNNKREKYFSFLTNNEIKKIEDLSISIFNTVNNRT